MTQRHGSRICRLLVSFTLLISSAAFSQTSQPATGPASQPTTAKPDLILLHSNDIHDTLKNTPQGGIAYLSTFIHEAKAKNPNVLAVNCGDMLQKGDLFSVVAQGVPAYEALKMTGTDVTVPGNHDFAYGADLLLKKCKEIGMPVICDNVFDPKTHKRLFPPTLEMNVDGVRVGLIGGTVVPSGTNRAKQQGAAPAKDRLITDTESLGKDVDQLSREMDSRVDLTIVIFHNGTQGGIKVAELAPDVDIVVCGHSNEVTNQPIVTKTGALVVDAGRAAERAGEMQIVLDKPNKKIKSYSYKMVKMDPAVIKPDEKIVKQVAAWEKEYLSENTASLATLPAAITGEARADFLGNAILEGTKVDVVMVDGGIFRASLPKGPISTDQLYKTIQPRYNSPIATFTVTGEQLKKLIQFRLSNGEVPIVRGVAIKMDGKAKSIVSSSIDPMRKYKVATYQAFIIEPNHRPTSIKGPLDEMKIQPEVGKKKTLDYMIDYVSSKYPASSQPASQDME